MGALTSVRARREDSQQRAWSVPSKDMKEAVLGLVLLILPLPTPSQLIGHRGVISLPDNFEYRDEETMRASRDVADYALRYQPLIYHEAQQNRLIEVQKSFNTGNKSISFYTWGDREVVKGGNNDNFFHYESRFTKLLPEQLGRINNINSPGEHPCTYHRTDCDVTEETRLLALQLKVEHPANQDGLTNRLVGVGDPGLSSPGLSSAGLRSAGLSSAGLSSSRLSSAGGASSPLTYYKYT